MRLDEHPYQFLFSTGDEYTFMDQNTFEQITLNSDLIGEPAVFLQEGMVVTWRATKAPPSRSSCRRPSPCGSLKPTPW